MEDERVPLKGGFARQEQIKAKENLGGYQVCVKL